MILITGASSGIGAATAEILARRGQSLWLVARRAERLQELAQRLGSQTQVRTSVLDVADRAAVAQFARDHAAALGATTVLINNAGLARGMAAFDELAEDDWETMIDTNLKGLARMTQTVLPAWRKRGHGHIVNVGSVAGRWAYPKGNIYAATKAAVSSLTESLRLDLLGSGIRVTLLTPGMVETEFSEVRLGDAERAKAVYQGMQPLTAHDVGEAIAWAIERPAHVNVQEIVIYPTDQGSTNHTHRKPAP